MRMHFRAYGFVMPRCEQGAGWGTAGTAVYTGAFEEIGRFIGRLQKSGCVVQISIPRSYQKMGYPRGSDTNLSGVP
jgi:hypothetical protein